MLGAVFGISTAIAIAVVLILTLRTNFLNTLELLEDRSAAAMDMLEDSLESDLQPARNVVDFLFDDGSLFALYSGYIWVRNELVRLSSNNTAM